MAWTKTNNRTICSRDYPTSRTKTAFWQSKCVHLFDKPIIIFAFQLILFYILKIKCPKTVITLIKEPFLSFVYACMHASLREQLGKQTNETTCARTYLSTRSRWERLLWSFPPNGQNRMRTDSPLSSFNVYDPLKAVLFKMNWTNNKNTFRCEICPVRTNKSKPLIPLRSDLRTTMQRNPSSNVWFIAAPLYCTATGRHYLVCNSRVQFMK